jgi:FdhD protein
VQKQRRTTRLQIHKVGSVGAPRRHRDLVVVEEPLTILWQAESGPSQRLAATMRTPGDDNQLAAGLLFSEGLLRHRGELEALSFCVSGAPNELNRVRAQLRISLAEAERRLAHRPAAGMPQSACGLCGFDQLSSPKVLVQWAAAGRPVETTTFFPDVELLHHGLDHLANTAPIFSATGASHAVVLIDSQGGLLAVAEDVGRHNACDKAVGELLLGSRSALRPFALAAGTGVVFSSRLSFELAAKAARAGVAWMASVGAPTDLALELATLCGIPTLGFLGRDRYNIYHR